MIFNKQALLALGVACAASPFSRVCAVTVRESSSSTGDSTSKGGKNPPDSSKAHKESTSFFMTSAACPQKCMSANYPVDSHLLMNAIQKCDAASSRQMWDVLQDGTFVKVKNVGASGDSTNGNGWCLGVVPQVASGLGMLDNFVFGQNEIEIPFIFMSNDGWGDHDMCSNGSKLGLVSCDHPSSQWSSTDGQLISTFCWGIGLSSFLSVNEECTDLHLSTTSDGTTAISRQQTFMAVTQAFIETIPPPSVNPAPSCDVSGCEEGYECYDVDATGEHQCLQSFTGKVLSNVRITGPEASAVQHITLDYTGASAYTTGHSLGIALNDNDAAQLKMYSIASSRYGDDGTGTTASITVKCGDTGHSQKLCDTQPGDEVVTVGTAGGVMLMPEEDPSTDYIMVATGTGIAPFRGFIRRLFYEDTPATVAYKGEAWLFFGVANSDALLYDDEFQDAKARFPNNFRLDYAIGKDGIYIQDKVELYADQIFAKLEDGASLFLCVSENEMTSIEARLRSAADLKGIGYDEFKANLKNGQRFRLVC